MHRHFKLTLAAALVSAVGFAQPALTQSPAEETFADIEQTLGFVPDFLAETPEHAVAGFWSLIKDFELNPDTALDGKTKTLISLGVAAQIPCDYCIYSGIRIARSYGATDQEIQEAVTMAGLTRLGSTLLNGLEADMSQYQADIDRLLAGD
jgi:AhpD family alkylhydroperoxidase